MRTSATESVALRLRDCATVPKALAEEIRLRLLESLLVEENCVTELVREVRWAQPHVSRHLRILRDAGLLVGLDDGKQDCYPIMPVVRRTSANGHETALDFSYGELRFPNTVLTTIGHARDAAPCVRARVAVRRNHICH